MSCSNPRVKRSSSEPRAREGVVSRLGVEARDEVKHDVGIGEGRNDFHRRFSLVEHPRYRRRTRRWPPIESFSIDWRRPQPKPPSKFPSSLSPAPLIKILKIRPVAQRIMVSLRSNLFLPASAQVYRLSVFHGTTNALFGQLMKT